MMGEHGKGYTVQELRELISGGKLSVNGVIQEYIEGDDFGAVGLFDIDGNFIGIESIHKQRVKDGHFTGVEWTRGIQEFLHNKVQPIFQAIGNMGIRVAGHIGIDFRAEEGNLQGVYETNPRVTGASPIPVLLRMLKNRPHIPPINSAILNTGVQISLENLQDYTLLKAITSVRARHPDALILPQGIVAGGSSKVIFATSDSDTEEVEEMFMNYIG